jgi:RNA polymerase sigma-70 factor (ECF subfamily)
LNEKILIVRLRLGEEPAFKELVANYQDRVYYSVLNILQNTSEAEDAAQETFIQVFESIHSFKEESTLATWVYRIAVRKSLEKIYIDISRVSFLKYFQSWDTLLNKMYFP